MCDTYPCLSIDFVHELIYTFPTISAHTVLVLSSNIVIVFVNVLTRQKLDFQVVNREKVSPLIPQPLAGEFTMCCVVQRCPMYMHAPRYHCVRLIWT